MDVSLRQLRTFREVAEVGTVTGAADTLGYTPSAVSQQLAALERSIGVSLTEKSGRRLQLTDAGRELLRHATDLLQRAELAQVAVELSVTEAQGRLDVGLFESVVGGLFAPALHRLADTAPLVDVHSCQIADPDTAFDDVLNGTLDVAFAIDYPHAPGAIPKDVSRRPVYRDVYKIVLAAGDPMAAAVTLSIADLAERDWVGSPPEANCGRSVVAAARRAGFEPRLRHSIDDYSALLRLVAAGAGVALVPTMALRDLPHGIEVIEATEVLYRQVDLVHRASSAGRPALEAFVDAVQDVAQQLTTVMSVESSLGN